jgi:hypothetical protein
VEKQIEVCAQAAQDLHGKHPQVEKEKTAGVDQPVHTRFIISNLSTKSFLDHLEITTHWARSQLVITTSTTRDKIQHSIDIRAYICLLQ